MGFYVATQQLLGSTINQSLVYNSKWNPIPDFQSPISIPKIPFHLRWYAWEHRWHQPAPWPEPYFSHIWSYLTTLVLDKLPLIVLEPFEPRRYLERRHSFKSIRLTCDRLFLPINPLLLNDFKWLSYVSYLLTIYFLGHSSLKFQDLKPPWM